MPGSIKGDSISTELRLYSPGVAEVGLPVSFAGISGLGSGRGISTSRQAAIQDLAFSFQELDQGANLRIIPETEIGHDHLCPFLVEFFVSGWTTTTSLSHTATVFAECANQDSTFREK
jgi:hypothetical protein